MPYGLTFTIHQCFGGYFIQSDFQFIQSIHLLLITGTHTIHLKVRVYSDVQYPLSSLQAKLRWQVRPTPNHCSYNKHSHTVQTHSLAVCPIFLEFIYWQEVLRRIKEWYISEREQDVLEGIYFYNVTNKLPAIPADAMCSCVELASNTPFNLSLEPE